MENIKDLIKIKLTEKKWSERYEVMKYTGHTTLSAFEKYIKSIFAEPPKDLSDKITVVI